MGSASEGMGPGRGAQSCHFGEPAQECHLELHTPLQHRPTSAMMRQGPGAIVVVTAAQPPTLQRSSQAKPTPVVPPAPGPDTFSLGALGIP